MPKLSRRKRQLKELNGSRSRRSTGGGTEKVVEDEEGSEEEENEEETESNNGDTPQAPTPVPVPVAAPVATKRSRNSRGNSSTATSSGSRSSGSRNTKEKEVPKEVEAEEDDNGGANGAAEKVWVQCNNCDKWRALPPTVDPESLPDIWTCSLNIYDPDRDHCDAPEENYSRDEELLDQPLKGFLKLWVKKLKNADRAETRMSSAATTRGNAGRKRKADAEWIRCSNPSCGKWRAISRGIDSIALLKKLNKNKRFGGEPLWYCSMNSWDDTTASCAAPQEPLWDCRWNLMNK